MGLCDKGKGLHWKITNTTTTDLMSYKMLTRVFRWRVGMGGSQPYIPTGII